MIEHMRIKRGMMRLLIIVMCVATVFSGCTSAPTSGKKKFQAEYLNLFDTLTTIVGYTETEEEFGEVAQKIHDEMQEYHRLYDIYFDYKDINNIKTINDNAGVKPVEVDQRIIDLLLEAKEMYQKTDGKFNVAFGSVLSIWHEYRTEGIDNPQESKLPPMEELKAAAEHMDISKVIIDEEAKTVFLEDKDMSLDVGAIGKGYAVQRVTESMKAQGYDNILVSVGGNICAIGSKPENENWVIGIQSPEATEMAPYACKVAISSGCVVTSGDYQRYYTVDGKRYNHIIDRDTLMPATNFRSVSLVCQDSGRADALSTALCCMTYEEGLAFVKEYKKACGEEIECMWIMNDGDQRYTDGFKEKLQD